MTDLNLSMLFMRKYFLTKKNDIGCVDKYRQVNWGQGRICSCSLLKKGKATERYNLKIWKILKSSILSNKMLLWEIYARIQIWPLFGADSVFLHGVPASFRVKLGNQIIQNIGHLIVVSYLM